MSEAAGAGGALWKKGAVRETRRQRETSYHGINGMNQEPPPGIRRAAEKSGRRALASRGQALGAGCVLCCFFVRKGGKSGAGELKQTGGKGGLCALS